MKYRNNLKGPMSFKSFIPPKISEYEIDYSEFTAQADELDALFSNLRDAL